MYRYVGAIVALLACCVGEAATNLLVNGSFELEDGAGGAAGWTFSSATAGGFYNAGTGGNLLGEDKVGVRTLYLVQKGRGSSVVNTISQTAEAVVPGQYRIVLQTFKYYAKGSSLAKPLSDLCQISAATAGGTQLFSLKTITTSEYSDSNPYNFTFTFPDALLGEPFAFSIMQRPYTTSTIDRYRAIDNVEFQLFTLEVAAGTTLVYTNGIMSAEQSVNVRENATLVFRAADGFETLPSVSLWDGAKVRIDCEGWAGTAATLSTSRGFLGPLQGAALDDPLSRIELANADGVDMELSADAKAVMLARAAAPANHNGFVMRVK